jgi:uncharacterized protein (DUF488 family)
MERIYTIGAYGFDAERFFGALEGARIDLFLDIRRRRGIRGPLYTFGNAGRLQPELERRGITYRHILALAPDEETRRFQREADEVSRQPRRDRTELSDAFVREYTRRTIDSFDWEGLVAGLKSFRRPVFFCVERTPEACHRGLVASWLASMTGLPETHLTP